MVAAADDAYRAAPLTPASLWRNSAVPSSVYQRVTRPRCSRAGRRVAVVAVVASAEWMTHKRAAGVACYWYCWRSTAAPWVR